MLDEASFLVVVRDVLDEPSTLSVAALHELSGLVVLEPSYALAVDWMVCEALARMAGDAGRGRSTCGWAVTSRTRPSFDAARQRLGTGVLRRRQVLSGAYRLVESGPGAGRLVQIAASGPSVPAALARPRPWPRRACARTWST
ncbi:MAG: hypothetical protein R2734_11335 [Nocardioides sp.]